MNAPRPFFTVFYNGRNITAELLKELNSITYTDNLADKSDELTISVDNTSGKWLREWLPTKGDTLSAEIGYEGFTLPTGEFTIDEITASGAPDTVSIKSLAAGVNSPLRSKRSFAYETQTLKEIAQKVADDNSIELVDGSEFTVFVNVDNERQVLLAAATQIEQFLAAPTLSAYTNDAPRIYNSLFNIVSPLRQKGFPEVADEVDVSIRIARANYLTAGQISGAPTAAVRQFLTNTAAQYRRNASTLQNRSFTRSRANLDGIQIARTTQNQETDLAFLNRIGAAYGILFSVRGNQLVFIAELDIQDSPSLTVVDKNDLSSYSLKDKTSEVYKVATVSYFDPRTKKLNTFTADTEIPTNSEDTLQIIVKSENEKQAEEQAKAALNRANTKQVMLNGSLAGNPLILAGVNVIISGFGELSGKFTIVKSTHTYSGGGAYITTFEAKKVAGLDNDNLKIPRNERI